MSECMRILRHEAGHACSTPTSCIAAAGGSSCSVRRRHATRDYYRPNPASRHYVQHLRLWYAQSHPDEDFAETFAVWLRPRSNWRTRYAGWPALKKLEYVDELMAEIADATTTAHPPDRVDPLSRLTETLAEHYERKRAHLRGRHSEDLRPRSSPALLRRPETSAVAGGVHVHQAPPRKDQAAGLRNGRASTSSRSDAVLRRHDRPLPRANLRAVGSERKLFMDFTVLLTAKTMHCAVQAVAATVDRAMKRLRVLVLVHPDLVPPESPKGHSEQEINEWKTEYDVVSTLRASGHDVRPLGVQDELKPIRDEIEGWKPHVVFNLLEQFHGEVDLRPERRKLSRADAHSVHRLQPARPDAGARQGPVQEARCTTIAFRYRPLPSFRCGARSGARRGLRCR